MSWLRSSASWQASDNWTSKTSSSSSSSLWFTRKRCVVTRRHHHHHSTKLCNLVIFIYQNSFYVSTWNRIFTYSWPLGRPVGRSVGLVRVRVTWLDLITFSLEQMRRQTFKSAKKVSSFLSTFFSLSPKFLYLSAAKLAKSWCKAINIWAVTSSIDLTNSRVNYSEFKS